MHHLPCTIIKIHQGAFHLLFRGSGMHSTADGNCTFETKTKAGKISAESKPVYSLMTESVKNET